MASLCLVLLGGCGDGCAPRPLPPEEEAVLPEEPGEVMTLQGVDLFLHDPRPTSGAAHKPTFWVHADSFEIASIEENVYTIGGARAVIYGAESGEEEIILEAPRGRFVEDRQALLEDGVTAYVGATIFHLSEIEWQNPSGETPGEARSSQPLTVDGPQLQLEAGSLMLRPGTKEFELTDVAGIVRFGRNET